MPTADSAEVPAFEGKPSRAKKPKGLYSEEPPPPPDQSGPESEAAAAVFHNLMGKEEPTPVEPKEIKHDCR